MSDEQVTSGDGYAVSSGDGYAVSSGDGYAVSSGDGYAVSSVDALGDGYGFRKIRRALDVTAFGVNAIVLPPGIDTGPHYHDEQEELYIALRGAIELRFDDDSTHRLEPGGLARVDPSTHRSVRNVGSEDAVYVVVGGKGGYVGRDGQVPEGAKGVGPIASRGADRG